MVIRSRHAIRLLAAFSCAVSFSVRAESFEPRDFDAKASFTLDVIRSKYLKLGTSKIQSQSASVSLAHGLMPGNSDGLEVVFYSVLVTQEALTDILNNDSKELRRADYATLVLYLNERNEVWQVNLSYVVPGTTVATVVAWKPEDLKKYFSHAKFDGQRLILKSEGIYSEADPERSAMKITWDVDLDLPVIREVNR
jgi:hypothetical protein